MEYNIKAIPTTYNGVRFRSRLEARWAAFFDLARVKWQYEPFDLDGWAPDFLIAAPVREFDQPEINVLVEVKPFMADAYAGGGFRKAIKYWDRYPILLCGLGPTMMNSFGSLCDLSPEISQITFWADLRERLSDERAHDFWREAGNLVQWNSAS